jgi:hypothetical protein
MHIGEEAAEGVLRVRTLMVNVYLVRTGSSWVLVDAGLRGYARTITTAAEEFIGSTKAPERSCSRTGISITSGLSKRCSSAGPFRSMHIGSSGSI